jgi:hypothetical protein
MGSGLGTLFRLTTKEGKMNSTYDLSVPDQMLAFDTDCRIASFFLSWYHDETLWDKGWSKYLSGTTKATFDRYAIVRRRHILDMETKKTYLDKENLRWRVENKLELC